MNQDPGVRQITGDAGDLPDILYVDPRAPRPPGFSLSRDSHETHNQLTGARSKAVQPELRCWNSPQTQGKGFFDNCFARDGPVRSHRRNSTNTTILLSLFRPFSLSSLNEIT